MLFFLFVLSITQWCHVNYWWNFYCLFVVCDEIYFWHHMHQRTSKSQKMSKSDFIYCLQHLLASSPNLCLTLGADQWFGYEKQTEYDVERHTWGLYKGFTVVHLGSQKRYFWLTNSSHLTESPTTSSRTTFRHLWRHLWQRLWTSLRPTRVIPMSQNLMLSTQLQKIPPQRIVARHPR